MVDMQKKIRADENAKRNKLKKEKPYVCEKIMKYETGYDVKLCQVISARKYIFPKPDIAGGVLYQILEKL